MALRVPNTKKFAPEEVKLVEDLVKEYWGKSAREMSSMSHRFAGWALAEDRETIPYVTAMVGWRKPADEECKIGLALEDMAAGCLGAAM